MDQFHKGLKWPGNIMLKTKLMSDQHWAYLSIKHNYPDGSKSTIKANTKNDLQYFREEVDFLTAEQLEPFSEKSRRQTFLVRNRWFQTFWLLSIQHPEENYIQSHYYTHSRWVGNTTHMLAWNVLRLVRELNTRWSWELIVVKVISPNTFQRFRLQDLMKELPMSSVF